MKPNLKCKICGNIIHFSFAKKDAKWDEKTQKWRPVFTPKSFAVCDICNSTDIERINKKEVELSEKCKTNLNHI